MASWCDTSVMVYVYIILICFKFLMFANSKCVFFRQVMILKIKKHKDKKIFKDFFSLQLFNF